MFAERRSNLPRTVFRRVAIMLAVVLVGGMISASLVRFSPGFGVDERELDSRLTAESIGAIKLSHASEKNVIAFYTKFVYDMFCGKFGTSRTFDRPIAELMRERLGNSLHSMSYALSITWLVVLLTCASLTIIRNWIADLISSILAGALLAVPAAMIAFWSAATGHGPSLALIFVLAPTLFRYVRNILERSFRKPHVLAARAKGINNVRLLVWHLLPTACPQILGLVGVSVSMAFGALIPIEYLCDSPGIGQLALLAALGRDLPLLIDLTLAVTIGTLFANLASDVVIERFTSRSV
jgi:ABC-type dipeptide/oligopeptide/nickel transport system permease component